MAKEGDSTYLGLLDEMRSLHTRKMTGYTGNDPDPWRNFREARRWGVSDLQGVMVRLSDKYLRIVSLMENEDHDQVGESMDDTLMDLAAYSLIAICIRRESLDQAKLPGSWPLIDGRGLARSAHEVFDPQLPKSPSERD